MWNWDGQLYASFCLCCSSYYCLRSWSEKIGLTDGEIKTIGGKSILFESHTKHQKIYETTPASSCEEITAYMLMRAGVLSCLSFKNKYSWFTILYIFKTGNLQSLSTESGEIISKCSFPYQANNIQYNLKIPLFLPLFFHIFLHFFCLHL